MIYGHEGLTEDERAEVLSEHRRDAARQHDAELAACAREVLAAYARRDWQAAAMHGAALADLTLEGER